MENEEEKSVVYQPTTEQERRFLTIAQVNDPVRLDYGPLLSPTARALEKILPMQDPAIPDQSYGPLFRAGLQTANLDAVRKHGDEMSKQSGMNPKPGDPPSFAPMLVRSVFDSGEDTLDSLRHTATLGGYLYDQATGQGEARTRARLDAAKAEKQAQAQATQKKLMFPDVVVPGDPAQTILNGERWLAETLGGDVVDSLGTGADYVGTRLGGPAYLGGKAAIKSALHTGNNFANRYDKTGELDVPGAAVHGMISGVLDAIPTPVKSSGAKKNVTDHIKQAGMDTGKKQIGNLSNKNAAMGDQSEQDRKQLLQDTSSDAIDTFVKRLIYYSMHGGK